MFDPAQVGSRMAPGDKVSISFHKAKEEGGSGFLANAKSAGLVPGGAAPAPPQMSAVSRPALPGGPAPVDHRALLLARMRQRLMLGR